jgi:uncharacterized RDD family membrane protein YckC
VIDSIRRVETPEGVEILLHLAGPLPRAAAYGVDVVIRSALYLAAIMVLSAFGDLGEGPILLVLFVGEWFYPVFFEVLASGRSPGKRLLNLQVLHDDGTPIGWTASLLRNLLRFADFFPFAFGAGLVCASFHRDFKRLGDIAAGTVVVYHDPLPAGAELPLVDAQRPPWPLTLVEERAILQFAERQALLGGERAAEIADYVMPLTGRRGSEGVEKLLAIANWLVGRR